MNQTEEKIKTEETLASEPKAEEPPTEPAQPQAAPAGKAAARKPLPRGAKVLLGVAAVLLVLVLVVVAYINGKLDLLHYDDGTLAAVGDVDASEDQDLDVSGLVHNTGEMEMPEGSPFADEDVLNILLIGTDERTEAVNDADAFTHLNQLDGTEATTEFSDDARADAMILVSLDLRDHTIRLVSIERATGVPILLDGFEGQYDWITHTFRYGGPKLTMDTVEDCFNVQVDHYVRVNFNSFVQIVDAVGGVDIEITDLEAKALNWEVPSNSMLIVNKVDPGLNHFDGYTALQYARLRQIDSDWKRIERQRTVIATVLDSVKNASVAELDNLLNTVLPLVQTNFTKTEIAALLVQLPGFLGAEVEQLSMPLQGTYGVRTGMDDRLMYDPDWAVNIEAMQNFLYHGQTAEEVIAATPESAATAESAQDATAETASDAWDREVDPDERYIRRNLHMVDLAYPLSDADFGRADYRLYLAGTGGARDAEVQAALADYLAGQGVRVVAVPGGAAAGILLDRYLQTGDTAALTQYLATLPQAQRAAARAAWQGVYQRWPGVLHAAGLGEGTSLSAAGYAAAALARSAVNWPEEAIRPVAQALQGGSDPRTMAYWFCKGMRSTPREMERWLGDAYQTALRLYQGGRGTVHTGDVSLTEHDLRTVLDAWDDGAVLAFVPGDDALQTGESLGSAMRRYRKGTDGAVCSIGVVYGAWGNDATFTPDTPDTLWDAEALGRWLGGYVTPGRDALLALDGDDCPFDEGDPLLREPDVDVTDAAQKLLVLDPGNAWQPPATPETAARGW